MQTSAKVGHSKKLTAGVQQSATYFLRTEVRTGLTLAKIALEASRSDKRERNRVNARKAYDAILRFRNDRHFSPSDRAEIEAGLAKLRSALKSLGEKLEE